MRPEFLIPVCIKSREESVALYSRPQTMAYPVIAPLAGAVAADERRHLQVLHELHRKASAAAAARAAAQAADPV
jgi:hypothetical protein